MLFATFLNFEKKMFQEKKATLFLSKNFENNFRKQISLLNKKRLKYLTENVKRIKQAHFESEVFQFQNNILSKIAAR